MYVTIILSFFICTFLILLIIFKRQKRLLEDVQQMKQIIKELTIESKVTQHDLQTELRHEKKAHVLLLAYRIRDTVHKQEEAIYAKTIENTPLTHGLSDDELAQLFSPEQALIIQQYFFAYRQYIKMHWTNSDGKNKTIFRGTKDQSESELGQLHLASSHLVKQFDQWLIQLQSTT